VHGAHVDALVARGLGIVGGRPQRLSEIGAGEKHVDGGGEAQGHEERIGARLVQEQRADGEGLGRVGRPDGPRHGREDHGGGVGDDEGHAEGQDELGVHLTVRIAPAGDPREEDTVEDQPHHEERRDGDEGAHERVDAQHHRVVVGEVHPQHHEVALREVDHAHDAEDEGETDAHEGIDAPHEETGHDVLG
jgi:hypothetical protein